MRILVVSQYFWPENFRINDLCSELVQRGHDVTVLTGTPNYPQGTTFSEYKKNPQSFSEFSGVEILRVPIVVRGSGGAIQLIINYFSYAISASIWGLFKLRKKEFDVVFIFQLSPITLAIPGLIYKHLYKTPVVLWVLDLWPETLQALGVVKSKSALKWIGYLVSYVYNHCDLILGQSKAFLQGIKKYCNDKNKIKYFPSWAESNFSIKSYKCIEELTQFKEVFKVLFAGNVGESQDFSSILNAVDLLKNSHVKIKFFIVGDGRVFNWVRDQIEERDLDEWIVLMGRYPLESMPDFYASADALLVSLKPSEVFSMTIPGKIQSYMAAEKPILAMLDGEGARVITEARAGLVCSSGDYKGLASNVIAMSLLSSNELSNMSNNAQNYAKKEFDRDILITQLERWFEEVSNGVINE